MKELCSRRTKFLFRDVYCGEGVGGAKRMRGDCKLLRGCSYWFIFKLLIQFRFARHRPLRYPDRAAVMWQGNEPMLRRSRSNGNGIPRTFLKRPPEEPSLSGQQIIWKLLMVEKFPLCALARRLHLATSSVSPFCFHLHPLASHSISEFN